MVYYQACERCTINTVSLKIVLSLVVEVGFVEHGFGGDTVRATLQSELNEPNTCKGNPKLD
jgi:hypothetical protein